MLTGHTLIRSAIQESKSEEQEKWQKKDSQTENPGSGQFH